MNKEFGMKSLEEKRQHEIDLLIRDICVTKLKSDNKTETEISKILGISQPTVNRVLARTEHGRFHFNPVIPESLGLTKPEVFKMMDAKLDKPNFRSTLTKIASDDLFMTCLLYTSPSPRDQRGSRMPSSA